MKLQLRDLKQNRWELEVDPSDTVAAVKQKNSELQGYEENIVQKLIYSGRILKDTEAIASYEIDPEKGYVVCMTSKKKVAKASEVKTEPQTKAEEQQPATTQQEQQTEPFTEEGTNESTFATGNGLERIISNIIEMGYDRALAMTALRMAYNNPDRAVEYLLTGQAQERQESISQAAQGQNAAAQAHEASEAGETGDAGSTHEGDEEMDTTDVNLFDQAPEEQEQAYEMPEDIRELRELVRANPSIMEPLIQQLASQNPDLAEAISENLDEFLDEGDIPMQHDEQNTTSIDITPEENAAISRLMELGFDRSLVIQAYFACDKNEDLTANYLFEHGNED